MIKEESKYPRAPMTLDAFFRIKEGHQVCTRYQGPGIVITPPEEGVRIKARIALLRPCWQNRIEELNHRELTPLDEKMN